MASREQRKGTPEDRPSRRPSGVVPARGASLRPNRPLDESERNFRTLMDRFPHGVAVHAEGTLVYVNPAAAALLGYDDAAALAGRAWRDFVHPDELADAERTVARALVAGERTPAETVERRLAAADGTFVSVALTVVPVVWDGGAAVLLVSRDLSGPTAPARERSSDEARSPGPSGSPTRVLVVDDDDLVLRAMQRLLRDHHVTIASSGKVAVELARNRSFDVIICDLTMPGMTGVDVYRALARDLPGTERKVVFLSGGAVTQSAQEFLDSVPNPTFVKPIAPRRVNELLESVTKARPFRGIAEPED